MQSKYEWLEKKTPRSVEQLRLWSENPRLNPQEEHITLSDFAEDFTQEGPDKKSFFSLINSIVEEGFVPADPIIVWQDSTNHKYYVAEGNRRILALKLLRNPNKAPKGIRAHIRKASNKINLMELEKVNVYVAPSFEDAEWYINQRNSASSLQQRWSRVQQQRWILELYNKHNGDFEKITTITKLSKSDLENFFRILKIKDFIKIDNVKSCLNKSEFDKADSYKFPITILERFFNFSEVRKRWGLVFDGNEVNIISNKKSFYYAFSELIKRIVNESDNKINTRMTTENLEEILNSLPTVTFSSDDIRNQDSNNESAAIRNNEVEDTEEKKEEDTLKNNSSETTNSKTIQAMKGNPNRNRLVLSIYKLNTDSYRLEKLFNEFKSISVSKYPSTIASALRVFLDLAVFDYITRENIVEDIQKKYQDSLRNIVLKKKLQYIEETHFSASNKNKQIIKRLLNPDQQFSLDTLNGFIHNNDTYDLNRNVINGFWDFLFPLFDEFLDIKEVDV
ncbi:ParB/Srx family N-terminal domain-containing protein [Candidatus Marinarcus aquaticus]|uniref:Uncharacterized protein n=1 Tax=Candidatus Marinarcus aquaticus TaxID=2044504 RepID=A0A4V1LNP3_9BACT|nr:ParB/Srx family N-terminal domain-containing protein [Candidatus Marinarcus aquaticus]RXJ54556.1 hypothetical protein CRV04_11000 [Candidatus Marinarcus aquaticus]